MTAAPWCAQVAFGATAAAVLLTAFFRREHTLLRGRSVLFFTAAFVAVWLASAALTGMSVSGILIVATPLLAIAFVLRRFWLAMHATAESVDQAINASSKRLLLDCAGAPGNRFVKSPATTLLVRSWAIPGIGTIIDVGPTQGQRKLELFRSLLGKQYRSAVPLPRIKM